MNSSSGLSLGGSVPPQRSHLHYPTGSMPVNHQYATPQIYFQPPSYYDVSLNNHMPPKQLMQERHNCAPLAATQRHNCDTFTVKHNDVKARVERRISELNAQLQCAPSDTSSPWWDELGENYFHPRSSIMVIVPQSGRNTRTQKYLLEKTPHAVLEFFKSFYEHQVSHVVISFKSGLMVTEKPHTREIEARAPNALLSTEHHQPQSVKVTTEGQMALIFTPQLKIQYLEFDIKSASEFVARKNLQTMNRGAIHEMRANSTCYGLHKETIQFLKMARVLESMQVMMAQHKSKNSIPQEIITRVSDDTSTQITPPPRVKLDIPARNQGNIKNLKNARKNRKRKLESENGTGTKRVREEVFQVMAMAEVEVMRHNLRVSGRTIQVVNKNANGCHSNSRHSGMFPPPNQMCL